MASKLAKANETGIATLKKFSFRCLSHDVNESLPLIYMWEIRDHSGVLVGRYVGKAKAGASRPRKHYKRNVENIFAERDYRKGNPQGYRRVHLALADAIRANHEVVLTLLCNVRSDESINAVERRWIKEKNSEGTERWQLNG